MSKVTQIEFSVITAPQFTDFSSFEAWPCPQMAGSTLDLAGSTMKRVTYRGAEWSYYLQSLHLFSFSVAVAELSHQPGRQLRQQFQPLQYWQRLAFRPQLLQFMWGESRPTPPKG